MAILVVHLRFSTHRSGGTVRRYVQLVESYRRPDGVPAHRVVASLGQLSDREVDNLKLALAASRAGKAVVIESEAAENDGLRPVGQPLAYLDVAVGLATWERLRVDDLLRHIGTSPAETVAASKVLAALTLQRCIDPDSKLAAVDWFEETALPELLDVAPSAFNNSRIHRVLDQLEAGDDALQAALGSHYADFGRPANVLFLDVTDTWFEGRGPDLVERGRTKEGMRNRRKVGLVLLCNDAGFPMRWKVLAGHERETDAMKAMVTEVARLPWVGDAPLVCDRAMGQAGAVSHLATSGVRFVTAAYRTEIASWTASAPLPTATFERFEIPEPLFDLEDDDPIPTPVLGRVQKLASAAGFERVADDLFLLDLGLVERDVSRHAARSADSLDADGGDDDEVESNTEAAGDGEPDAQSVAGGRRRGRTHKQTTSPAADWLRRALDYQARLDAGEFRSRSQLAAAEGFSRARITQLLSILRLHSDLQSKLLRGDYGPVSVAAVRDVGSFTREEQRRLLESIGQANASEGKRTEVYVPTQKALKRRKQESTLASATTPFRLVAAFNPVLFVDQRRTAMRQRRRVEAKLADLNRRIAASTSPRTQADVFAQATSLLRGAGLKSVYTIAVQTAGAADPRPGQAVGVTATLRTDVWSRRRRYDGLVLLVCHASLTGSARDIVRLYRDKDAVEKDFQTIKSVIKLRPVYHRTDAKLRAHVTICMIALLLERSLERRLNENAAIVKSAPMLFTKLKSARIERLPHQKRSIAYKLGPLKPQQVALLKALDLSHLTNATEIASRIHPRLVAA